MAETASQVSKIEVAPIIGVGAFAEKMGLPGPDDYILLLIRMDKQDHELQFPSPECRKRSAI